MYKANPDSPRMFESDFVDFFSRTHPAVVPVLYVPATGTLLWWSVSRAGNTLSITAGLYFLGVLAWSLTEYWLHRLFFHWVPEAAWGERMHFLVHGVHHTWPRDKYRLVMPPAVSLTMFFVFFAIFLGTFGRWGWALHAGFVTGYMLYDMIHYALHHFRPRSEYGKRLKRHHMTHHFKDHTRLFGVSSRLWDLVFRTQ